MQTEQREHVAIIMLNYVKDFAIPEDNLREQSKSVTAYNVLHKARKDKTLRDRVRRILKTLAAKKFPPISQLSDISIQEEDAESVLDSNEDDVLEDDNETASIKKDAEIEKLKGVVINLTGVSEKYKEQRLRDPVKVDFFVAMYNKFKRGLP